jgi:hypothetical protein
MAHGAAEPTVPCVMTLRTVMETMVPATASILKFFLFKHISFS